jgi:predicted dehydrogenase
MIFTLSGGIVMSDKINWGVLGCARIAVEKVIPSMKLSRHSQFYAIASRDKSRADRIADRLGASKSYGNYDELLSDPDIQAVYIPLPNHLHEEWTIKAAQSGKHVLCEKPMGITAMACRRMIDACRDNGVYLMEAFMYRLHPATQKVKQLIDQGVIGEIRLFEGLFSGMFTNDKDYRMYKEFGGGSLYDVGCYAVNAARYFIGKEPISVFAHARNRKGVDIDTSVSAVMMFDDMAIASIYSGFDSSDVNRYSIIGTKGVIDVPSGFAFWPVDDVNFVVTAGGKSQPIVIPAINQYVCELDEFSTAILDDRPLTLDVEDAYKNAKVIEALHLSWRNNAVVNIE